MVSLRAVNLVLMAVVLAGYTYDDHWWLGVMWAVVAALYTMDLFAEYRDA